VSRFSESQCEQSCQPTTSGQESAGAGGAKFVRGLLHSELDADEIHLWYACLDRPAVDFRSLLSPDETIRAQRFHLERDRQRFIVRRGLLRTMLSGYLHADPGQLQFCCGRNGKPTLTDESGRKICFNLSHAGGLALYGFTRGREIGVDIERVRDVPNCAFRSS
jgi:4'-phosphopantetheinyl transferase